MYLPPEDGSYQPSPIPASDERSVIASVRETEPEALEARFRRWLPTERQAIVQLVSRHLADPDPRLRESCAWILHVMRPEDGTLSPPAVEALVVLARDRDDDVRDWALFALGRGGAVGTDSPEVRAVLHENATNPNPRLQREAIEALAQLGDLVSLQHALDHFDVDPETVEAAIRLGSPHLVPSLLALRARGWTQMSDGNESPDLVRLLEQALSASELGL